MDFHFSQFRNLTPIKRKVLQPYLAEIHKFFAGGIIGTDREACKIA